MSDTFDFLAQLPLFAGLYDDELDALSQIAQEYEFDDRAVIAYQRDVADSIYIVRSGRLFARGVDDYGIVRDARSFFPGDCFGDTWLFAPEVHPFTVKGAGDGRILIIKGVDFLQFINSHPNALENLAPEFDEMGQHIGGLSEEAWDEAQKSQVRADRRSRAISLLPDELVEFYARRSRLYLLLQVIPPIIVLLLAPVSGYFLTGQLGAVGGILRLAVPVLLILVAGAWLAFQLLDWSNDYFVITNKHLAHREFSLRTFRTNVNKIPIDQIQSVEIERPSFLSNLLNFGTARITTAAQSQALYFDNIDNPGEVGATLNRLRGRVQAMDAGRIQATMRHSLESHFQVQPALSQVADEDDSAVYEPQGDSLWRQFINRYKARVEQGGTVTYRKHIFVLFGQVLTPFAILFGLTILGYVLDRLMNIGTLQILLIVGSLFLADLGWVIWRIEDWRNDTFQVNDRYVIDVDRRPFGFGESRKQAELSNVQNVNSDRPNFWATIFNYGNVIIETAGATADITFENVSNPNRVQTDVFKRRDQYRQRANLREGESRRKEYAVLLDVYQQAREQDRIPRRTPPPGEE